MTNIRRWYVFLVSAIALQTVAWAIITLLRNLLVPGLNPASGGVSFAAEVVAFQIAVIVIGLPIYVVHWLWAGRLAESDREERIAKITVDRKNKWAAEAKKAALEEQQRQEDSQINAANPLKKQVDLLFVKLTLDEQKAVARAAVFYFATGDKWNERKATQDDMLRLLIEGANLILQEKRERQVKALDNGRI